MSHMLRFLQVFALGTWVGAIIYFATVVTPGVFGVLASRDEAGALVGFTLGGLHLIGAIAAAVFVGASVALGKSSRNTNRDAHGALRAFLKPAALGVILMAALTTASQDYVMPRMEVLRARMGSVDATPLGNPLRMEFDRWHAISVRLEGGVLLIGMVALFLTVRRDHPAGTEENAPT